MRDLALVGAGAVLAYAAPLVLYYGTWLIVGLGDEIERLTDCRLSIRCSRGRYGVYLALSSRRALALGVSPHLPWAWRPVRRDWRWLRDREVRAWSWLGVSLMRATEEVSG